MDVSSASNSCSSRCSTVLAQLRAGIDLGGDLRVTDLRLADLDEHLELLARVRAQLAAEGNHSFLDPHEGHEQIGLLAPAAGGFGAKGLTLGVRERAGGRLVATACLDLHGPFLRLDEGELANTRVTRQQVAVFRSAAVDRDYRRRGLARTMVELRLAVSAALGRIACVSLSIGNASTMALYISMGFVIVDLGPDPRWPGQWLYYLVDRPAPRATFRLEPGGVAVSLSPRVNPEACAQMFACGFVGTGEAGGVVSLVATA